MKCDDQRCRRGCERVGKQAKETCARQKVPCQRVCGKVDRITSLGLGGLLILAPGISVITLWVLGEGKTAWVDPQSLLFGINHLVVSVCIVGTLITDIDGADACKCGKWKGVDKAAMAFSRTFLWFMSLVYGIFCLVHLHDWDRKAAVHGILAVSTAASCAFVRAKDLDGAWEE